MKAGNRLYSFPILNGSTPLLSQYKEELYFNLIYEKVEDQKNKQLIIKDVHCSTNSNFLNDLVLKGKANVIFYIECPRTLLRRTAKIGFEPKDIIIPYSDFWDLFSISAFIVANEDMSDVSTSDLLDDYQGDDIHLSFKKYQILAVFEGDIDYLDYTEEDAPRKESIFSISSNKDENAKAVIYTYDNSHVNISIPENEFKMYGRSARTKKNIYLSMFGIPALSKALYDLKATYNPIDETHIDLFDLQYRWFRIFRKTFEDINGRTLNPDDFDAVDEIVQQCFDYIILKGIKSTYELGGDNDED